MVLHGVRGDVQPFGDLAGREALRHELGQPAFALRESVRVGDQRCELGCPRRFEHYRDARRVVGVTIAETRTAHDQPVPGGRTNPRVGDTVAGVASPRCDGMHDEWEFAAPAVRVELTEPDDRRRGSPSRSCCQARGSLSPASSRSTVASPSSIARRNPSASSSASDATKRTSVAVNNGRFASRSSVSAPNFPFRRRALRGTRLRSRSAAAPHAGGGSGRARPRSCHRGWPRAAARRERDELVEVGFLQLDLSEPDHRRGREAVLHHLAGREQSSRDRPSGDTCLRTGRPGSGSGSARGELVHAQAATGRGGRCRGGRVRARRSRFPRIDGTHPSRFTQGHDVRGLHDWSPSPRTARSAASQ